MHGRLKALKRAKKACPKGLIRRAHVSLVDRRIRPIADVHFADRVIRADSDAGVDESRSFRAVLVGAAPAAANTSVPCVPWVTPGSLPAAEERALNDALGHIDAGTGLPGRPRRSGGPSSRTGVVTYPAKRVRIRWSASLRKDPVMQQ